MVAHSGCALLRVHVKACIGRYTPPHLSTLSCSAHQLGHCGLPLHPIQEVRKYTPGLSSPEQDSSPPRDGPAGGCETVVWLEDVVEAEEVGF